MSGRNLIIENEEPLVRLRQIDREPGKPLHGIAYQTRLNWAKKGSRGVRLEVVYRGDTIWTSEAATKRFIVALNTPAQPATA